MDKPCRGLKWIAIIIVPVHYYIIILLSSYGVFENLLNHSVADADLQISWGGGGRGAVIQTLR